MKSEDIAWLDQFPNRDEIVRWAIQDFKETYFLKKAELRERQQEGEKGRIF